MSSEPKPEPLLRENKNKCSLFPIQYPVAYKYYKKASSSIWLPEEVDLSKDRSQWNLLSEEERKFFKVILAFFSVSDFDVMENAALNMMTATNIVEIKNFYGAQIFVECIHQDMYSLLIENLITNPREKEEMFNAIKTFGSIKRKMEWQKKFSRDDLSFAERIVAFAVIEGIFFSGSFAAIFWLKQRGILKGLTLSNEFISKDEALHCEFATYLYSELENKLEVTRVREIIESAVEVEKEFFEEALPVDLKGMNKKSMVRYIKYVADRLCYQLTKTKIYGDTNPFPFVVLSSLIGKTNFFERRVSEYEKSGVGVDPEDQQFALNSFF